ncbi:MAG: hypothetical protein HQM11_05670 [SAR324 cluster bacterium]|nr:hypothetical protein [SAR324 cluster bacterium]
MHISINEVLQQIDSFSLEDQEFLLDTLNHRIHEAKRLQLLKRAKVAETNFNTGNYFSGSAKDLMNMVEND